MGSGPKTKNTDKMKFFKVNQEGGISPAFPNEKKDEKTKEGTDSFARIEPVFSPTDASEEKPPQDPGEVPETPMEPDFAPLSFETSEPAADFGKPDTQREIEIDLLKPQIDSIKKIKKAESLSSEQVDVLKKFLSLTAEEARDLREQHQQYQSYLDKLTKTLETLKARNAELESTTEEQHVREKALRAEIREMKDRFEGDIAIQKNEYEDRLRRSGNYDAQAEELVKNREEWKQKVREELKRIKLKERELETKYELLKRDMQALLDSKDKHLVELKKKSDALELEMESLEDRLRKSNVVLAAIDSKKKRLIETMRLAISLLEEIDHIDASTDKDRKAG